MAWLNGLRELSMGAILLRIFIAMVIGGILGSERGRKNRPAGFRTYMLVSVGSALVMMTNQYVHELYGLSDPVRMGAQVISGIGFLGAGTIIVTRRSQVKGITTAAGLWTAACCGLAVGIGFYEGALAGGLVVYIIMVWMQKFDTAIHQRSKHIELYVEYDREHPFSDFIDYANEHHFNISEIQMSKNKLGEKHYCATLVAVSRVRRKHGEMLDILRAAPHMLYVEEL